MIDKLVSELMMTAIEYGKNFNAQAGPAKHTAMQNAHSALQLALRDALRMYGIPREILVARVMKIVEVSDHEEDGSPELKEAWDDLFAPTQKVGVLMSAREKRVAMDAEENGEYQKVLAGFIHIINKQQKFPRLLDDVPKKWAKAVQAEFVKAGYKVTMVEAGAKGTMNTCLDVDVPSLEQLDEAGKLAAFDPSSRTN